MKNEKFVKSAIEFINKFDAIAYTKKNQYTFEDKLGWGFIKTSVKRITDEVRGAFSRVTTEYTLSVSKFGLLITDSTSHLADIYESQLPAEYLEKFVDPEAGEIVDNEVLNGKAYRILTRGTLVECIEAGIKYKLEKAAEYLKNRGRDKVNKYDNQQEFLKSNRKGVTFKNGKEKPVYNDKGLAMKTLMGDIDKLKADIAKIESKGQSGNTLNSVNKTIMELMEKNENSEYGLQGKESEKLKKAIATRKTLIANKEKLEAQLKAKEEEMSKMLGNSKLSVAEEIESFSDLTKRVQRINNFALTGKFFAYNPDDSGVPYYRNRDVEPEYYEGECEDDECECTHEGETGKFCSCCGAKLV